MPEEPKQVGRRYRGEGAAVRTPQDVAALLAEQAPFAAKPGAMPIASYFVHRGILDVVMQASMLAYTNIRVATPDDFDVIFQDH